MVNYSVKKVATPLFIKYKNEYKEPLPEPISILFATFVCICFVRFFKVWYDLVNIWPAGVGLVLLVLHLLVVGGGVDVLGTGSLLHLFWL